nr:hypothetical protein [Tsukamurella paurometabola]
MAIEFIEGAVRHGFTIAVAMHVISNARCHEPQFAQPRVLFGVKPDLWIGPSMQPSAPLIEVMAEVSPPSTVLIDTRARSAEEVPGRIPGMNGK